MRGRTLFFCSFLGYVCSAQSQDLSCTASHEESKTTFTIKGHTGVFNRSQNDAFSWSNGNGIVIANHLQKDPSVISATEDTLVFSGCIPNLTYKKTIHNPNPEFGNRITAQDYFAVCSINCDEKPLDQHQDQHQDQYQVHPTTQVQPTTQVPDDEATPGSVLFWVVIVVSVFLVLLLLIGAVVLFWKDKILGCFHQLKGRCSFTRVPNANGDANV